MAGRPTPAPAKTDEPGTETVVTPVEQDVAPVEPVADPRESALANLLAGNPAEPVITPETELVVDESAVQDFGGNSRAVVVFDRYNQIVDGLFVSARKGSVIDTDAASLKRGVRIGALRKLEG